MSILARGNQTLRVTMWDLEALIRRLQIDELIVVPTALGREALLGIYRALGVKGGVRVRLSPGLYELFTTGMQVKEVGCVPLTSLNKLRITGMEAFLKTVARRVWMNCRNSLMWCWAR